MVTFDGATIEAATIWVDRMFIFGVGARIVVGLKFDLSDNRSLMYGDKRGQEHTFKPPKGKKIVGLYGRQGDRLDGIGFLLGPVHSK